MHLKEIFLTQNIFLSTFVFWWSCILNVFVAWASISLFNIITDFFSYTNSTKEGFIQNQVVSKITCKMLQNLPCSFRQADGGGCLRITLSCKRGGTMFVTLTVSALFDVFSLKLFTYQVSAGNMFSLNLKQYYQNLCVIRVNTIPRTVRKKFVFYTDLVFWKSHCITCYTRVRCHQNSNLAVNYIMKLTTSRIPQERFNQLFCILSEVTN